MRIAAAADSASERLALALNLAPLPGGLALFGMSAGRVVGVAQRIGVYRALLETPASPDELATRLGVREPGLRLMCELLAAEGILEHRGGRYSVSKRARVWVDPASERYIGTWLEHTTTYWPWWGDLERVVRDGGSFEIHGQSPDDEEYWRLYITGQYEIARLSAAEVAKAIRLPDEPTSLLDVAGAHGGFAAALCRRHPGLSATVVDLPGSVRVGRAIMRAAGMDERVRHVEGDMFTADLGGPHDGALLFDIVHHLSPEQTLGLLRRIRGALRTGAPVAVLDMFRAPVGSQTFSAASLGLLFHLTSGADLPDPGVLADSLEQAGFTRPRRTSIRRIPDQALYQAFAV